MQHLFLKLFLYCFSGALAIATALTWVKLKSYDLGSGVITILFVLLIASSVFSSYSFSRYIQVIVMEKKTSRKAFLILYPIVIGFYFLMITSMDYFMESEYAAFFLPLLIFVGIFLFVNFRFLTNLFKNK